MKHVTVLLNEGVDGLNIKSNGIYVDATLGGAGHSSLILSKLTTGHLYAFDQDDFAINQSKDKLKEIGDNFTIIKSNFKNIKEELAKYNIDKIDGIIYDLGVSSFQFDDGNRGFSYKEESRLDMRMNQDQELDAYQIVNYYSEKELSDIFYKYGEEDFAKKIAHNIILRRDEKKIETTFDLVEIVKASLPQKVLNKKGHPAKKVFQALRIAVNDELNVFETSLKDAIDLLNIGGRVVVITFHSLEDRIAKHIFKELSIEEFVRGIPVPVNEPILKLITRHPIYPSDEEIENNNRSHSAKMRVAEKIKEA